MNTENDDIKTILDHLRLDTRPGPARPLTAGRMREKIDSLIERRSAIVRGRWYTGLAISVIFLGAVVATVGYERPTTALAAAVPSTPTIEVRTVEPAVAIANASDRAGMNVRELPVVDVAALPAARSPERARVANAPAPRAGDAKSMATEAEDLLRAANRLRSERAWAEAARTYEEVVETHAGSAPSYPAMVAAATLRLERLGDPSGALRLYLRALDLRPSGALSEDALFGVARAERALGHTGAERDALEQLLTTYPSSWHAVEARARVAALGSAR